MFKRIIYPMIYGLIAEYNPLHEGHKWQINYIKETLGATALIVAFSGDFTQRGIPGVRSGYERAKWAIDAGADLVVKLPVTVSTGGAETFAMGGVALLRSLGIVDRLVFSAEIPQTEYFDKIASALNLENDSYRQSLKTNLKSGMSFPKARATALKECLGEPYIEDFLSTPNNILGVEYVKAILASKERLDYTCLQRQPGYQSSTEIRNTLSKSEYIHPEDFSLLIHDALVRRESFSDIFDITRELSNRILNYRDEFKTPEDFALNVLKSRNYTYAGLLRALFHILLDIKDEDIEILRKFDYAPYCHILAVKKGREDLISDIKKNAVIPVFTGFKEAKTILSSDGMKLYKKDLLASDIYRMVYNHKIVPGLKNIRSEGLKSS